MTDEIETNHDEANFWFSAGHVCGYLKRVYGIDLNFREDDTSKDGGIVIECSGFKDISFSTSMNQSGKPKPSFLIYVGGKGEVA